MLRQTVFCNLPSPCGSQWHRSGQACQRRVWQSHVPGPAWLRGFRMWAAAVGMALDTGSASACWDDAAARHGVPRELLIAIARTESGMNATAVHRNHDRAASYDIGLMQINSTHLPTLRPYGIDEQALFDPCVNLHVGAWILADLWRRLGTNWTAVGAYNASCAKLRGPECERARARYAWRVYRNLDGLHAVGTRNALPRP